MQCLVASPEFADVVGTFNIITDRYWGLNQYDDLEHWE
jgi:hypothetical protein